MLDLAELIKNDMSLVAIAVGTAEGTRTPKGDYTAAYWGHKDPGNGRHNQGSFSFQGNAASPHDADRLQLLKLHDRVLPEFKNSYDLGVSPNMVLLFVTACDVFTQSEAACLAAGGFIERVSKMLKPSTAQIIEARVQSYYNPTTGKLNASGFGNDINRLRADQTRRQECINAAIKAQT